MRKSPSYPTSSVGIRFRGPSRRSRGWVPASVHPGAAMIQLLKEIMDRSRQNDKVASIKGLLAIDDV